MTIHISDEKKIQVTASHVVFKIMQEVLLNEEELDMGKEHFWVIALSNSHQIMNIELISLGSRTYTVVEPLEVFNFARQKQAAKIILVHNHPSGVLAPSGGDLDITDRLIQCGKIMKCPVVDHLIITVDGYMSFLDTGLLGQLELSTKYAIDLENGSKKWYEIIKAEEIAKKMILKNKYDSKEIKDITGLTMKRIEQLRKELSGKIN